MFSCLPHIRDNIAYGAVEASEEDIINASKSAQLHDYIASLPNNTIPGWGNEE